MKKLFRLMVFLFLCSFICIRNSFALTDELKQQSKYNLRYKYTFGFTTHNLYFAKQVLKSNNHDIYNFHMPFNKQFDVYNIYKEIPNTSVPKALFLEMQKIAYYGDMKYRETNNELYYFVTQGLIVKALKPDSFNYSENDLYTKEVFEKVESSLENEIDNYFIKPSFDNKEIEINLNDTLTISDENNILSSYQLENAGNDIVSYKVVDNKIILKALKPGVITFKLKKEFKDKDYDMEFLYKENKGSSSITPINFAITPGNFTSYSEFKVRVNTSRIGLDIKDDETISGEESLNVNYGIYNQNNELIYHINTNVEGIFYTDYLPYGKYYIKQISNSALYEKDNTIYKVNLNSGQEEIIVLKNHKKKIFQNTNETNDLSELRQVNISFLDEEGRLIEDDVHISIMDNFYQINGKTSIILKDGNYLIKFLKIPLSYTLENATKLINVNDNMDIEIVLKYKEEGIGNEEIVAIDIPNTFSFNYFFIFIGLRYVKKFSK